MVQQASAAQNNDESQEFTILDIRFTPEGEAPSAYVYSYLMKCESLVELMAAMEEAAPLIVGAGSVLVRRKIGSRSLLWMLSFGNTAHQ